MAKKSTKVEQVNREDELLLKDVMTDSKTSVKWGKWSFSIGWLRNITIEKITEVSLKCEETLQVPAKTAALIWLNGFFKIKLFYWIVWRFMYNYVPHEVLLEIVQTGKKKQESQAQDYWTAIILVTVMRDTKMNMTREEADRILVEQRTGRHG